MRNNSDKVRVENIDRINFTGERKILLSSISRVLEDLSPSLVMKKQVESVFQKRSDFRNLYVIGFGKATLSMYSGARELTSEDAAYSGIIIPEGENYDGSFPELEVLRGTHPITSAESEKSTRTLLQRIGGHGPDDLFIVLISGGGSALFELPLEGITIEDIGNTAKCLMDNGADIRELNIIRHSMSGVKGGKLAALLSPSRVVAYMISDVPGDDMQLIASGPLVKPAYSLSEFTGVVEKFKHKCPSLAKLENRPSRIPEDDKFLRVENRIVLKNRDFVENNSEFLLESGQEVIKILEPVTGTVEEVSSYLTTMAREKYALKKEPFWLVCGGETTAIVKGDGVGGRNCELSLRVALNMKDDEEFLFASMGTDGIDGVSPAMGGITDSWFLGNTAKEEIRSCLETSDSYSLLNCKNSAILTGYTGTNVSDIFVLYYGGSRKGENI